MQDAVKADADQTAERLKDDLKKQNIAWNSMDTPDVSKVEDADNVAITIKGIPATQSSAFRSLVSERYPTYILTALNSTDYSMKLKPTDLNDLKVDTVKRAVDTIGNRIDQLGLAEKSVQQYGKAGSKYEVLVQLPGVDDPARAKELIGTAAVLEIVRRQGRSIPQPGSGAGPEGRHSAAGHQTGPLQAARDAATASSGTWWPRRPVITGREMRNARPGQDEFRKWETNFSLSQDGGRRFGRYTEANIGNKLAVVLDNQIVSVATIQSKIEDSGRITGLGSEEESVDLSRYLRSGSLPAGVVYNEERSIGPSLGADSIHQGIDCRSRRVAGGDRGHAGVLQALGRECGAGAGAQHDHPAGGGLVFPCGSDPARYCRNHSDHRYGGGFQRADFRTHPRGIAHRQERDCRGG